jgi:hypothetical protein
MAAYDHEKLGAVTTMTSVAEPLCASMRALRTFVAAIIFSAALLSGAAAATHKGGASSASGEVATPPEIAEFMALLADPKVQKWLLEEQHAAKASQEPAPEEETVSQYVDARISATREHFVALGSALPDLPNQFERAIGLVRADIPRRGTVVVLVLVFAALGFGVEWVFRKATQKTRQRLISLPMETVHDRLLFVAARFAFRFVAVVALPSAASAHSSRSIGRRTSAKCSSAISSPCSSPVSRWSSANFCSHPMTSGSASFRRIPWPRGSGADGSPRSSAGWPSGG